MIVLKIYILTLVDLALLGVIFFGIVGWFMERNSRLRGDL